MTEKCSITKYEQKSIFASLHKTFYILIYFKL